MSVAVGDKIGCLAVLELLEAAQARDRELCGYRGKPTGTTGAHALVRCDCLLEFIVRARELSRRKKATRCGGRCELGKRGVDIGKSDWTHCRNPMCAKELNPSGMGRPNRTGFCQSCKTERGVRRWYEITRPDAAEKMAQRIEQARQMKAERRAKGLCVQCGALCGSRLCEPHRLMTNEKARLRRLRCARVGMCGDCRRIAAPGRSRCAKHLAGDAMRATKAYHDKTRTQARGAA